MNPKDAMNDNDSLMNHVALEAMHAIEAKDSEKLVSALEVLVSDLLNRMNEPDGDE